MTPSSAIIVALLIAHALAGRVLEDSAKALLGSWKSQDDNKGIVRFEATKCTFGRSGESSFQISRATYGPSKIVTYSWARKAEYTFELKNNILHLTSPDGETKTYRKLDKTPIEVEVRSLTLGSPKALPKEHTQAVQDELARRAKFDQQVRTNPDQHAEMAKVDEDNTDFLVKLVQEIGWIDVERFGAKASNDAFLIVQHSMQVPLMLAALPEIEKDVKAKRLDAQPYALLYDRLQVMLGEKQRYGTQIGSNERGELILLALENRKRVEDLRREIGLFPLADYLKFFEKQNGGKPVTFQDDDDQ